MVKNQAEPISHNDKACGQSVKDNAVYRITAMCCMGILFLMFIFIILRIVIKNVVYEKMGIYNPGVAFFLEGDNDVSVGDDGSGSITIDWAERYPFAEEDKYVNAVKNKSLMERYTSFINKAESQAQWYATDGLPMQTKLTELAAGYESLIGWKVQEEDYDAVITLRNGYLTCISPERDESVISEITDSVTGFRDFLAERNINLMYVMVPFLIDTVDVRDEDIIADKLRLTQVLLNILSNGIKFNKIGGIIGIRVKQLKSAPTGYGSYQFIIRDTGIGMKPEFQEHIFESFSREETSTVSGIQGTGLGMAITKNIVDMMGGTITVKSEEGKGTTGVIKQSEKICNCTS